MYYVTIQQSNAKILRKIFETLMKDFKTFGCLKIPKFVYEMRNVVFHPLL